MHIRSRKPQVHDFYQLAAARHGAELANGLMDAVLSPYWT